MAPRRSSLLAAAVGAAVVVAAFAGGVSVGSRHAPRPTVTRSGVLDEAAARIAAEAGRPVDRDELSRAAVQGMLAALGDEWASYYRPGDVAQLRDSLGGGYSGIGLWIRRDGDRLTVSTILPRSPAEHAGIAVDDTLLAVGGVPVAGRSIADVVASLRGPAGTPVAVVVRHGATERSLLLRRQPVSEDDVAVDVVRDGVVRIRVAAFTRGVGAQVRDAMSALHRQRLAAVLLDLRGNPGGLLDEAVATAGAFLDGGVVVSFDRRDGRVILRAPAHGDTVTPLIVLVDAGTASAAEVVAAALQDRGRAVLVGSRTFGKGTVQEPSTLSDGSALELTVGRYHTPSGRTVDRLGLEPDVEVPAGTPREAVVARALDVLTGLVANTGGRG